VSQKGSICPILRMARLREDSIFLHFVTCRVQRASNEKGRNSWRPLGTYFRGVSN